MSEHVNWLTSLLCINDSAAQYSTLNILYAMQMGGEAAARAREEAERRAAEQEEADRAEREAAELAARLAAEAAEREAAERAARLAAERAAAEEAARLAAETGAPAWSVMNHAVATSSGLLRWLNRAVNRVSVRLC